MQGNGCLRLFNCTLWVQINVGLLFCFNVSLGSTYLNVPVALRQSTHLPRIID